jgi:hypothetical protein
VPRIINVFDAAKYGDYEEFLRWYGGDPNAEDRGLFLLESAALGRQDEAERRRIVSRLLADGADPTIPGPQGKNALDFAAETKNRQGFAEVAKEYGYSG